MRQRNVDRTILVTGATGTQGGAVARHLLAEGLSVRGLTRNPGSANAQELAGLGAQMIAGDLRDPASLDRALEGVQAVFSVQDFYAPGVGYAGEIEQGRNLAEAAKRATVDHFVQSTMAATSDPGDVDHFRSKFEIERIVRELGLAATFVGTAWFIDNVSNPKTGGAMTFPALAGTLRRDTPFQVLSVDDLGRAVAAILMDPFRHKNERRDLASETTTVQRMKADYLAVTGRRAKRWWLPNIVLRRVAPEFAAQLRWHVSRGWTHGPDALRDLIGAPTTFKAYLAQHAEVVL
ncbi:MAG: NmrA/HSCARG family protein [Pseudomonadota bacterium]